MQNNELKIVPATKEQLDGLEKYLKENNLLLNMSLFSFSKLESVIDTKDENLEVSTDDK